jgi:hypothetical protein
MRHGKATLPARDGAPPPAGFAVLFTARTLATPRQPRPHLAALAWSPDRLPKDCARRRTAFANAIQLLGQGTAGNGVSTLRGTGALVRSRVPRRRAPCCRPHRA